MTIDVLTNGVLPRITVYNQRIFLLLTLNGLNDKQGENEN